MTITGDGNPDCPCCDQCPPGHNACFQLFTASWDCNTLTWTGPTPGGKSCMPVGTSQIWTQTGRGGDGCQYRRYVRMPKCCTEDGDCTGEANTATPPLPFAGGAPGDCCGCTGCLIQTGCDQCTDIIDFVKAGPSQVTVMLGTITASPVCFYNTVSPFHVARIASTLSGRSFVLPWVGSCTYQATFDVTAFVQLLICIGDGTGCGACSGGTNACTSATLTITYSLATGGNLALTIDVTDSDFGGAGQGITFVSGGLDDPFVDCCTGTSQSTARDPMANDPWTLYAETLLMTPC